MVDDGGSALCDLVLPVYNGLTYVKDCVYSILECSRDCAYHLYVVDDGSDDLTRCFLEQQTRASPYLSLYRSDENKGFLRSCNFGIAQGSAPYVVLVNSDVIVTPGWLSRLVRCAEADPRIAAVNPFTNYASNINIPLAPGANFYGMDCMLAQHSPRHYPDVVTGVGFCLLLRRTALAEVGVFDEVYGQGYCEDSDLCMRLVAKGYRTVVADDVYVYHKGRASFPDREQRYQVNRKIFDARWAAQYQRQFRAFRAADPLRPARELFQPPWRWDLEPAMRETYRRMRQQWQRRRFVGVAREAVRGLRRLPTAKRSVATPQAVAQVTRPGRLRVTYVLHALTVAGGVLSVVQLVNELILLGVEARIVALREYPEIYDWKFLTRPIIFKTVSELWKNFPESDIAVATHWTTASWVAEVMKSERASVGAYFIQDYESWFFPEEDHESRAKVKQTYELIPHKIVKSDWLKGLLVRDGFSAHKIPLGMDLALFYPREVHPPSSPIILAMARPRTPRRGFPYVIEALRQVKEAIPEVEIVLFGDDLSAQQIPFSYRDAGIITDQNQLAALYSTADIFLDGSDFQGFGRTTLEAMACGAACVVTDVGGVTEYARDGENCVLVPPKRSDAFAEAILRILRSVDLKRKLKQGGFTTVKDYCHKREAQETLAYFEGLVGWTGRPGL
ncbi:MAG TPA: glycosyltransferase [Candidatus Binatia bacterium]|nr:glycosyltransferase [Candidatus Binatia bacterium]